MCAVCAFYEGGMNYETLCAMPVDEFFKIVDCANEIAKKREAEMKRNGK